MTINRDGREDAALLPDYLQDYGCLLLEEVHTMLEGAVCGFGGNFIVL
jgi:hypothetical protein